MIEWKDQKKSFNNLEIVSSEVLLGDFRLCVHHHIDYPADTWLASCPGLFKQVELVSKELNEAKCQAVAKLQVIFETVLKDIVSVNLISKNKISNELKSARKGDDYESSDVLPCAGIHIDGHGNAIEIRAETPEKAKWMRDEILSLIENAPPVGCIEEDKDGDADQDRRCYYCSQDSCDCDML